VSVVAAVNLDYLVIGHVTRDLLNGDFTIGGTASYSARTARVFSERVGVVTSFGPQLDVSGAFSDIHIIRVPAEATTTFKNEYTSNGRRQFVHSVAAPLGADAVPERWHPRVVHVGPIARECDPALVERFDDDVFIGLTPQGWLRRWDAEGHVTWGPWSPSDELLARVDAIIISDEDVRGNPDLICDYAARSQLLIVTHGVRGCTVYIEGERRSFLARPVEEIDPTGAGDIFAAAYFTWLERTGDPWESARLANCVATYSVTRSGLESVPTSDEVNRCKSVLER